MVHCLRLRRDGSNSIYTDFHPPGPGPQGALSFQLLAKLHCPGSPHPSRQMPKDMGHMECPACASTARGIPRDCWEPTWISKLDGAAPGNENAFHASVLLLSNSCKMKTSFDSKNYIYSFYFCCVSNIKNISLFPRGTCTVYHREGGARRCSSSLLFGHPDLPSSPPSSVSVSCSRLDSDMALSTG